MRIPPLLFPLSLAAVVLLSGCSGWWGESEAPPLPGDRISVLAYDQQVQIDPEAAKLPIALPPVRTDADWPAPDHGGGNYALANVVDDKWDADIGGSASRDQPLIATPVIANGTVYTMDSGAEIRAFAADTGKEMWDSNLTPEKERGEATGGGLAFDNNRLFAATGYGEVLALNPADGSILWRSDVKSPLRSAPTVGQGMVFVVSIDNQLIALSADSGTTVWTHAGISESAGLLGAPSPALFGNLLLVAYSSGELFALNALNGREQWEDNLASSRRGGGVMGIAAIRGQPVLTAEGSAALAISNSGRLVAIDTRSGQRVWDQRLAGNQMPWVAGSTVFLLTSQSQLMALNLADGKIRWLTQLAQWENGKEHSGVISWYGPVLAGGKLWITSSTGRLRSYSPEDGAEAADLDAGRAINRPPVVAGGTLYTLDDSATLTAWR